MDKTPYLFFTEPIEIQYNFESVSESKTVRKIVRFTETSLPNVFNLALLDMLDDGQESDLSVTNNDDLRTVLATVMRIIENFLTKFPQKIVTFRGSDDRRTRLYRIVIGRELDAIQQRFQVFGEFDDGRLEIFKPNADYRRFLILLKHGKYGKLRRKTSARRSQARCFRSHTTLARCSEKIRRG